MINPLVSIIIPVYNSEKYIEDAIKSAINQTWANKEIIIVDDGSTDNSLSIAKQFEGESVKILTQQNNGASAARNKGLAVASGDYIQFLDADDLLAIDKIEKQLKILIPNPGKIGICKTVYFFENEYPYSKSSPPDEDLFLYDTDNPAEFLINLYGGNNNIGSMIQPNVWLCPKPIIDKVGPWNEDLTVDDDGEYFCRVLLAADGIKYSPLPLNYYRKFNIPKSLSTNKTKQAYQSRLLATDLKYEHLKLKTDIVLLKKILSRFYWEIGVASFPQFIKLSNIAIQKAKQFGYNGPKYIAGKPSIFLSKILGWRVLRIISFIKYGF